jgi:hypothetical protein
MGKLLFRTYRKWILLAAILTILLIWIFRNNPEWAEQIFGQNLYPIWHKILNPVQAKISFPLIWPVFTLSLGYLLIPLFFESGWEKRAIRFLANLITLVALTLVIFYNTWGYNYFRMDVTEKSGLQNNGLNRDELIREIEWAEERIILLYKEDLSIPSRDSIDKNQLENEIRENVAAIMNDFGYFSEISPRIRILEPKGLLMRIGAAGVYLPFSSEGHIDAGLHKIQYPYTMAHEMSHAYGLAQEDACNFTAFIACIHSDNDWFHFSALFAYWRYLMAELSRTDTVLFENQYADAPEQLLIDLMEVRKNSARYPDYFPEFRDAFYDRYLKTQGIQEGITSYNKMVNLVSEWRKTNNLNETTD